MTDPVAEAAADIVDLYRRRAGDWVVDRGQSLGVEEGWLARFADALPPGGTVLDAGCGSGWPIAAWLIERGFTVTGVDTSGPLLDHARRTLPAGKWRQGDMRAIDAALEPELAFDGVLMWWSLFHLSPEDQVAALPSLLARVAPGGVSMMAVGTVHGDIVGDWRGDRLYHGSLDRSGYAAILAEAGFEGVEAPLTDRPGEPGGVWLCRRLTRR